jgi:hypothetical protein
MRCLRVDGRVVGVEVAISQEPDEIGPEPTQKIVELCDVGWVVIVGESQEQQRHFLFEW